jgi:hypothetical protein
MKPSSKDYQGMHMDMNLPSFFHCERFFSAHLAPTSLPVYAGFLRSSAHLPFE